MKAVSRSGQPIPWYTYSSIDFLKYRSYEGRSVLEFGGGQSTLWWANRAKFVLALEGDKEWYDKIKGKMPSNAELNHVSMESKELNVADVSAILESRGMVFDVIIIDGLYRYEMIPFACKFMKEDGIIICDNSEGYGIYEGFKDSGLKRVDFFGQAPGVVLSHCTSIYFNQSAFVISANIPIPVIATDMSY